MRVSEYPEIYVHTFRKNSILLGSVDEEHSAGDILISEPGRIAKTSTIFTEREDAPVTSLKARKIIAKLKSFQTLDYDWDSYGAEQPNQKCIKRSVSLVQELDAEAVTPFFVAPGPNGEILLEFKSDACEAEIYINDDGTDHILLYRDEECIFEGPLNAYFQEFIRIFGWPEAEAS